MSNERRRQGPRGPMGRGMRGNGEKAKNFKGTLKKLFVYLKPYYFKLAVVIIFAARVNSIYDCRTKDPSKSNR